MWGPHPLPHSPPSSTARRICKPISPLSRSTSPCNSSHISTTGNGRPEVKLAAVGQASLNFDPRDYHEEPIKTVAPILTFADLAFTNLEVSVNSEESPYKPTRTRSLHSVAPAVVDFLFEMNFGPRSLANNHSSGIRDCGCDYFSWKWRGCNAVTCRRLL